MPVAIAPIIAGLGGWSAILGNVVAYGVSSLFSSLAAGDERSEGPSDGPLVNKRSNVDSIPVIYGTRRAGGNIVYIASSGPNNNLLHVVLLVSEGEIAGFEKIYIDNKELRFNDGDFVMQDGERQHLTEITAHSPIGARELNESGDLEDTSLFSGNLVSISTHHGAADQAADAGLEAAVSGWTPSHRIRGRAYIYAKFTYDGDTFGGIPSINADIRGARVAPINNEGTGIDDDPANAVYSNNPALCLRDYLINKDYGRGIDPATIDDEELIVSANYCDEEITLFNENGAELMTGSRYTLDGLLQTDRSLYENTKSILTHMRGFLVFSSGLYKLKLDKAETSSVLYDESNIVSPLSLSLATKKNTLNSIRATFWNPMKEGDNDTVVIDAKEVRDRLDGGVLLSRDIDLPFCNNAHSARYVANQELEQSRQQIHAVFKVGIGGLQNDVGDIIRIQHAQMGWGYRFSLINNELVLVKNTKITIRNIGESNLFNIWSPANDYLTDSITIENGVLYKAVGDPVKGAIPNNAPLCSTGSSADNWCEIDAFSQIPNLFEYGIFNFNNGEVALEDNIGLDGNPLYKEFRILSLSMADNDEVELTCIEYDATVFDNLPVSIVDATPNTSFQNPNKINPPSNLVTVEELYVTTNSGGVKASIRFSWTAPNTAFVEAYDVFTHIPEQQYSDNKNYKAGDFVTIGNPRYKALVANGPSTANGILRPLESAATWELTTVLTDDDYTFLTRTRTTSATILDAAPGDYAIRVKAVSVTGVSSSALEATGITVAGLTAPPGDIIGFSNTPQGDLALLQWESVEDLDVRVGGSIQVRHTPTDKLPLNNKGLQELWASARLLTEGKSGVTTQILVPLAKGIYLVKAIDSSGVESIIPAAVLNTIESSTSFNFIRRFTEETEWLGIEPTNDHDSVNSSFGVEKYGNQLRLSTAGLWLSTLPYDQGSFTRINTTLYKALQNTAANTSPSGSVLCSTLIDNLSVSYTSGTSLVLNDTSSFGATGTGIIDDTLNNESFSWTANNTTTNTLTLSSALTHSYDTEAMVDVTSVAPWCQIDTGSLAAFSPANAVPVVTGGEYYFSNLIRFTVAQDAKLSIDLEFSASDITAFIDDFADIDSLPQIDGDVPFAEVTVEVSTATREPTVGEPLIEADFSTYVQFTSGTFSFTAARFRLKITTLSLTTQINIDKCDIIVDAIDVTQTKTNLSWGSADIAKNFYYENSNSERTPFFNDASIGSFAEPYVGLSLDGLLPGEYFELSYSYNDSSESFCLSAGGTSYDSGTGVCTISGNDTSAPHPWEGFRLSIKRVDEVQIEGVGLVPKSPDSATDDEVGRDISFDYQAVGF